MFSPVLAEDSEYCSHLVSLMKQKYCTRESVPNRGAECVRRVLRRRIDTDRE